MNRMFACAASRNLANDTAVRSRNDRTKRDLEPLALLVGQRQIVVEAKYPRQDHVVHGFEGSLSFCERYIVESCSEVPLRQRY